MIYTLTANPAIDMNFSTNTINKSSVNRTKNLTYSANGKGINVSLVLNHLGVDSTILGFFGGFTGKYIVEEMKKKKIETMPTWIDEDTRINVFANKGNDEYKFVNIGPYITKEQQTELITNIKSLQNCEILIISGSISPNVDDNFYDEILTYCKNNKIEFIIDISSKKLKQLLKYNPLLIKPNDEELEDIFNFKIKNEDDVKYILKHLKREGAKNIMLTLGDKGLYFYDGEKAYYCTAVNIDLISSACAGDACLGAFLSSWLKKEDINESLKIASAMGADVAASYGLGEFKRVAEFIKQVTVNEIYM